MDALESTMNINNLFERFTQNFKITLGSGWIDIHRITDKNKVSIDFGTDPCFLDLNYGIISYAEFGEPNFYHYSKKAGQVTVGRRVSFEDFLDIVKRDHPDFFEWILWNLN